MTVIAARLYRDGVKLTDVDLAQPLPVPAAGELLWIGLHEPTENELAPIEEQLKLHPLAVEDALDHRHLPKIEAFGDHLFAVARTVHLDDDEAAKTRITYGNTAIFMGKHFIVTVRHGSMRDHSPVRTQLEATPWMLAHGADFVLHAILDFIVDSYLDVIDVLEDRVLAMEDRALDAFLDREQTSAVFSLRRDLFRLQRVLGPMQDVAARCMNLSLPQIDGDMVPYFRDLHDHVRRADYRVAGLRDTLTSVIETSGLLEQQRQGAITRQLAAWAAILAVPTAIAGIYGMNFDIMPELRWRYGYFAILGVMTMICLTLYVRFKRAKWL
ncbi:magnesium and cobalt transport protein CorA [Blastomonas fulva]|uniref:Magnesium transporter n=1 Tax=Blastomonas fulva TaxID=1550728 RepID=A0ABM6M7V3_9SPHN|nr:magnesium and cobalt transport protein CorA [Blastomonas fulva]ASR52089.1 magnesium transporter [Blastomonas fulva]